MPHGTHHRFLISILLAFCGLWSASVTHAAQLGEEGRRSTVAVSNVTTMTTNQVQVQVSPSLEGHTWTEIAFACSVLVFGLLLVLIEAFLALKGKLSGNAAFKLIGLTIVICAGVFVIPAGFSSNQMTPLMGLLGAVAGYLLGKDAPKARASEED